MNRGSRISSICVDAALVLLFVFPALAIGGVHTWVSVVAALVASLATFGLIVHQRSRKRPVELPWFGAVLLAVAAWTALQMVPLPLTLLKLIAPKTAELIQVSWAIFKPSWHGISLDPGATLVETLKVGTAALAFIIAHNRLRRRERRYLLWTILVGVAALLSLMGLLGAVLAPGKPLLFYTLAGGGKAGGLITTSFVNPNHGAAFLSMATLTAIGLALSMRELQRRALLLILAVFLGSAVALTLSRGGVLALAAGSAFFGVLLHWAQPGERGERVSRVWPWLFGFFGATVAIAAWLAPEALLSEIQTLLPGASGSWDKIELWPAGLSMLKQNLWVGVGRGAFFTAFPYYMDGLSPSGITFSHLENQYLHLPIELGLPVGGALLLLSSLAWLSWLRRGPELTVEIVSLGSILLVLALHNMVDFNLELLGIALPAAIIAGALSAATLPSSGQARRRSRDWKRRLRWGALLGAPGLLLVLAALSVTTDNPHDDNAIALKLVADGAPSERVLPGIKRAIMARPADYLPHLTMARVLTKEGKPEAIRWLNRALFLNPRSAPVHLEAARLLFGLGRRRQGLVECGLALQHSRRASVILPWALRAVRNPGDLEVLLAEANLAVHGQAVQRLIAKKQSNLALNAARAMRRQWPREPEGRVSEINALLANKQGSAARLLAKELVKRAPSAGAYMLLARASRRGSEASVNSQNQRTSIDILREGWRRYPGSSAVGLAYSRALLAQKSYGEATAVVRMVLKGRLRWQLRARAHDLLATIYRADGRRHRARYENEEANRIRKRR